LSPWLLSLFADDGDAPGPGSGAWLAGVMLNRIDFVLTDPLGRRLGYTSELGSIEEIPGAAFSGDGALEQVLIPDAAPGDYTLELIGLGEPAELAFGGSSPLAEFATDLALGERDTVVVVVRDPTLSVPGGDRDEQRLSVQNIPGSSVRVRASIQRAGAVRLSVFDASGRRVRTLFGGERSRGDLVVYWDRDDDTGRPLGMGVYFVRLKSPGGYASSRVVIVR
jgi:hypothetical protein